MKINNNTKLKDLQHAFQKLFPYLNLEFFRVTAHNGRSSKERLVVDDHITVGDIREKGQQGELDIDPNWSTAMFEQILAQDFGLHVQIYRRSYGKWLQTWATVVWTLTEQNRRGSIMGDRGVPVS
jgi:hypothetical protein